VDQTSVVVLEDDIANEICYCSIWKYNCFHWTRHDMWL